MGRLYLVDIMEDWNGGMVPLMAGNLGLIFQFPGCLNLHNLGRTRGIRVVLVFRSCLNLHNLSRTCGIRVVFHQGLELCKIVFPDPFLNQILNHILSEPELTRNLISGSQ